MKNYLLVMRSIDVCSGIVVAALLSLPTHAQDVPIFPPPATPPVVRAVRAQGPVTIDGRLDEAAWRAAPVIRNFRQVEPNQSQAARPDTYVRIVFDERNLYVGAFCPDSLGRTGLRAPDMRRDFDYFEHDLFGVAFDAFRTQRNATAFQTNPYGAQRDLQAFDDNLYDREWDALWKVRTTRTDSGWVCEMQLPWATLRYPSGGKSNPADSTGWFVNFNRIARRQNQISGFPGYPRAYSTYRMGYVAELRGLQPPPASANIRVAPYVVVQNDRRREADDQPMTSETKVKVGGDLKWALNPHAVLDLTVNTDFAQADADRQVINLRRFNVFFPERRQFFLENAGLFAPSTPLFQPFFSRTIGLGDNGLPLPLTGGARYTDRTVGRGIGGLYVRQKEDDFAGGQNPAHFGVGRYLKNYGKQNNVGLLVTSRYDEAGQGRASGQNTTFTVDGLIRPSQPLTVQYLLSGSLDRGPGGEGLAGYVQASYSTNQFFISTSHSLISARYRPAMGFVARQDLIYHNPYGYLIWRPSWKPKFIRSIEPDFSADIYQGASDGRFQEGVFSMSPVFFLLQNGGSVYVKLEHNRQNLPVDFDPVGILIAKGSYRYNRIEARFATDPSSKLYFRATGSSGGYYNGTLRRADGSLRYSASAHAALSLDGEYNALRGVGIEKANQEAWLLGPELRLALNPRAQLTAFYQYSSAARLARWNVRASWEFQPLSYVYLVFNELANNQLDSRQQQTIGKVSYIKQF
ncbi:carbohydrate binding family 9 domain-containing protein [Hymenobacter terrenus]|uniref:carbohydrate binding family 9 domain-containing protein n=1 Tax=Hymenobacter terrenus TaxID=1629124 RepID=UPI0006970B86|nr:carbohydrate binding family 9 domain-containing protein [Hymenobacter terrenus]